MKVCTRSPFSNLTLRLSFSIAAVVALPSVVYPCCTSDGLVVVSLDGVFEWLCTARDVIRGRFVRSLHVAIVQSTLLLQRWHVIRKVDHGWMGRMAL